MPNNINRYLKRLRSNLEQERSILWTKLCEAQDRERIDLVTGYDLESEADQFIETLTTYIKALRELKRPEDNEDYLGLSIRSNTSTAGQ